MWCRILSAAISVCAVLHNFTINDGMMLIDNVCGARTMWRRPKQMKSSRRRSHGVCTCPAARPGSLAIRGGNAKTSPWQPTSGRQATALGLLQHCQRSTHNGENADPVKSGVLDIGLCEPHCGHCHSARAQRHQQSQTACNLLSRRAGEPLASHLMVGQDAAVDCSSDVVGNVRLDSTLEAGAARGGGGAAGLLPAAI